MLFFVVYTNLFPTSLFEVIWRIESKLKIDRVWGHDSFILWVGPDFGAILSVHIHTDFEFYHAKLPSNNENCKKQRLYAKCDRSKILSECIHIRIPVQSFAKSTTKTKQMANCVDSSAETKRCPELVTESWNSWGFFPFFFFGLGVPLVCFGSWLFVFFRFSVFSSSATFFCDFMAEPDD